MRTQLEKESPTRCKLTVEVEAGELSPHYERTFKRLAQEIKVPGFRKGKVPRAVIETRIGRETIDQEFLNDALPTFYEEALKDQDVRVVTYPDLSVDSYDREAGLTFTARFDVRPDIELPEYSSVKVGRPATEATDEEIDAQLQRLREGVGSLEPIGRNATRGDWVTINLHGYQHDKAIEEMSAEDLLYEVGSGTLVPELDDELEGKRAGDILRFNAVLPPQAHATFGGQEVTFQALVKEVQIKKLPDLDDDFAKAVSEFDTLEELRELLARKITEVKEAEAELTVRSRILEELIDRVSPAVPESMVAQETEMRLARFIRNIEDSGASIDAYLEQAQVSQDELVDRFRSGSEKQVAADLILDKVAEKEDLQITREDIDQEIQMIASRTGEPVQDVLQRLGSSGTVHALAGDILRRKALDLLAEHAEIIPTSDRSSQDRGVKE